MKRNGKYLLLPSMIWLTVFFVIPLLIVVAVSFFIFPFSDGQFS